MSDKPDEVDDMHGPMRELREYALGNLDVDHQDVHRIAGLMDEDTIKFLLRAERAYDPDDDMPNNFWDTTFAQEIIETEATIQATRAIRNNDIYTAGYMSGLPSHRSDLSGMKAIRRFGEWLCHSEQCKIIYISAPPGRGKTDMALLMAESIVAEYRRAERALRQTEVEDSVIGRLPTIEIAGNFWFEPTDQNIKTKTIQNFPELEKWVDKGSVTDNRWFIWDEASTHLTAQSGENAQRVAESVAPMIKRLRKRGVNCITIGHDSKDVAPAIRELCDYVEKPSLKKADFYISVRQREGKGHLFSVDEIPQTSWNYDTDDMAEWSWEGDGYEDDEERYVEWDELEEIVEDELAQYRNAKIVDLYNRTDLTNGEVGDLFGISAGRVSQIRSEFGAEVDSDEIDDEDEVEVPDDELIEADSDIELTVQSDD